MVAGLDDVVHHQLSPDGHQQVDGLNDQRQSENFYQRAFKTGDIAEQFPKVQAIFLHHRREFTAWPYL